SSSGSYLWARLLGGTGWTIATDSSGNVVVAGSFYNTQSFGGPSLTSAGLEDIFVAKYSSSGTYLWSQRFGGPDQDRPQGLAIDGSGNVLVNGFFKNTANLGGGSLTSAGSADIFLAKYSSTGAPLWSQRFGGSGYDAGHGVTVDGSGNVVMTGSFNGSVDLGGGPLPAVVGTSMFL